MVGFLMHKREVIILSIKVTRKLLKEYVKIKREIPLLRVELHEMNTTDSGLGNSVIQDCRKGYPSPRTVIGFDYERYNNKRDILEHKEQQCAAVEQWIDAIEDTQTCVNCPIQECFDKLAQYENTELTPEQIEVMKGHNTGLIEKLGALEEFVTNTKAVYQRKAIRLEKNERDARAILKDEPDREDVKEDLANIMKLSDRYSALLDFIDEIQKRIY